MAMEKDQSKLRILMFPWLAHGHITPFLELSNRLLTTNYFTIYLCSTSVNLNSIKTSIKQGLSDDHDHGSVELVELQMPSSIQLPPQLHTTKNLPSHLLPLLIKTFQESSSSFSDIMDSVKPHLLIYDYFQPWAPKIASSKGIPSVLFSTSSATALSFFHHVHTYKTAATFPFPAVNLQESEMARLINRVVPNVKDADDDGFAFGVVTRSTDILLLKTCRDVEEKYKDYLSVLCKKKIVCTGPLISGANENKHEDVDSSVSDIMKWLSGKSHGSTIYISFGSECFLSRDQIAEIAKGLQLCDVNFLWVIRFPAAETAVKVEDELPEGFLETVKERGLVVPRWAPQTKILGHSSIAGFVSHCGWSSVIESMYYGVPVITMPMKSEQPLNAQMVVEAGVGVGVERDGNGLYVGEKVAKAINKVMVEKAFYEGLRNEARWLGEMIREKEEQLGKEVAEELLRICMKKKLNKYDMSEEYNEI
ncbi:hypothetical protein C2S53_004287 [Perilla frutescens var. hirtella]|uniref:Glycosyltransferase n=1 Tax=Perilla frutescens var. hirtella TaxID=608512 RepID=A0AAD4IP63_PERFH|nr:hypothetical protein C2S53_004287 [Perilla frutescens var. hirtella]